MVNGHVWHRFSAGRGRHGGVLRDTGTLEELAVRLANELDVTTTGHATLISWLGTIERVHSLITKEVVSSGVQQPAMFHWPAHW